MVEKEKTALKRGGRPYRVYYERQSFAPVFGALAAAELFPTQSTAAEVAKRVKGVVRPAKPCTQCQETTLDRDGFCSDSCRDEYNDQLEGDE